MTRHVHLAMFLGVALAIDVHGGVQPPAGCGARPATIKVLFLGDRGTTGRPTGPLRSRRFSPAGGSTSPIPKSSAI